MVEIADTALVRGSSVIAGKRPPAEATSRGGDGLVPLTAVAASQWRALAERANEPNGYYLPDWELAVNASARGRTGVAALAAWSQPAAAKDGAARLIGLLPAISMWRAWKIPLPVLVSADPYGTLGTPPLDRDMAEDAAAGLMMQARKAGAHALILRDMSLDGAAMKAFREVLRQGGMRPRLLQSHLRACLDATRDADECLRDALGPKKLKELRRQRNRLAEHGEVRFEVASTPQAIASAVEIFLQLEASGWKGQRGTALLQHDGDAGFVRRATAALAELRQCEIVTLLSGDTPVAAAVVLRHQDRAFYFKLGVDEHYAKFSPGVQLTLDLTRHLCADPAIRLVDSTASADHPMINPIWRGRLAIGDVLIPLRPHDPVVPLVRAALKLRQLIRDPLRRAVHLIRKRQEKPS
ncbi:GNAT family N-acetyltransferase [Bradyrhizobium sediminis]|uniref:GNAT family N-acetyltransferase n=1 Tax=Bradyrhizobium sediminis TaxID=2840469 RepID=A0A975RZH3_9BRAD|nr:GNAT family N-acetyltransferase [Bradyrhizobium sediminis]